MSKLPVCGFGPNEVDATEFYQPSRDEFAKELADSMRNRHDVREIIPLPDGRGLVFDKHLTLELPRGGIPRFRRIYGYIGTAQSSESGGALTPACFQLATKLNFRYGSSEPEYADEK